MSLAGRKIMWMHALWVEKEPHKHWWAGVSQQISPWWLIRAPA